MLHAVTQAFDAWARSLLNTGPIVDLLTDIYSGVLSTNEHLADITSILSSTPFPVKVVDPVEVSNFPDEIKVSNFPDEIKVSNFPEDYKVSNWPATISNEEHPDGSLVVNVANASLDVDILGQPVDVRVTNTPDVHFEGPVKVYTRLDDEDPLKHLFEVDEVKKDVKVRNPVELDDEVPWPLPLVTIGPKIGNPFADHTTRVEIEASINLPVHFESPQEVKLTDSSLPDPIHVVVDTPVAVKNDPANPFIIDKIDSAVDAIVINEVSIYNANPLIVRQAPGSSILVNSAEDNPVYVKPVDGSSVTLDNASVTITSSAVDPVFVQTIPESITQTVGRIDPDTGYYIPLPTQIYTTDRKSVV